MAVCFEKYETDSQLSKSLYGKYYRMVVLTSITRSTLFLRKASRRFRGL